MPIQKPFALYRRLRIKVNASPDQVKRAYRRLALALHPDRTGNDPKKARQFQRVAEAYHTLADPEKRSRYDKEQYAATAATIEIRHYSESVSEAYEEATREYVQARREANAMAEEIRRNPPDLGLLGDVLVVVRDGMSAIGEAVIVVGSVFLQTFRIVWKFGTLAGLRAMKLFSRRQRE